jgi:multiple antibiotic resistance protein
LFVSDVINAFLLVYAGLFPIVNPIGGAPIFLGLTRQSTDKEREVIAGRVAVNGFLLLLGSMIIGSHVLEFFGITLPIVRIAGGLVVSAFAWQMLHSGNEADQVRVSDELSRPPQGLKDAFYPLTMPLTVGPGSMSVAIALGSQRPWGPTFDPIRVALIGGAAVLGLAAIAATIYVCYRFAERTVSALGETGTNVLVRLSAFILLCIGIEIIWTGYAALVAPAA